MNINEETTKKQAESENCVKKTRADYRREKKAAMKAKESKSKSGKVQGSKLALCDQELLRKIDEITENLKAKTWRHLKTSGKFKKNEKISFISDDMLIVGCDIWLTWCMIRSVGSPVGKSRTPGSKRGVSRKGHVYQPRAVD